MISFDADVWHLDLAAQSLAVGAAVSLLLWTLRLGGRGAINLVVAATVGVAAAWSLAPVVAGLVVGVGALGARLWRTPDSNLVPVSGLISLAGVWAGVPDTEPALIAGLLLAVVVCSRQALVVSRGDRVAVVLVIAWAAVNGSVGRPEVIGGIGCIAVLASPMLALVGSRWRVAVTLFTHSILVVVASRVVTGLERPAAVCGTTVVLLMGLLVTRVLQDPGRSEPDGMIPSP